MRSYEVEKNLSTSQPLNLSTSAFTVGIIEGVMGLFDGKGGRNEEENTTPIAKILNIRKKGIFINSSKFPAFVFN